MGACVRVQSHGNGGAGSNACALAREGAHLGRRELCQQFFSAGVAVIQKRHARQTSRGVYADTIIQNPKRKTPLRVTPSCATCCCSSPRLSPPQQASRAWTLKDGWIDSVQRARSTSTHACARAMVAMGLGGSKSIGLITISRRPPASVGPLMEPWAT